MPRIAFACLCAAVLAMLPACASGGQNVPGVSAASTESSSTDSGTSGSSSEADTTPPLETSGTESAGATQGGQPSLTVASLPIGADPDAAGCLTINFEAAASEVPAGMSLVVTAIKFTPDEVKFGGSACPQETPVCRPGLVLTETGSDQCFASIRTGDVTVGTKVKVKVEATVDCTGGQVSACVRFKEKIESDASSQGIATFEVSEPDQSQTTPTDQSPSPSESDSPSDSATTSSSS